MWEVRICISAGVGVRGDTVTVKRRLFRGKLYPTGLAVYASPENLEKFAKEREVCRLYLFCGLCWCISVCMCVCVCVCTCSRACTYIPLCVCVIVSVSITASVSAGKCVCVCVCMSEHIHVCMCAFTFYEYLFQ